MSVSIDYTGGVFKANRANKVGTVASPTGPFDIANAVADNVTYDYSAEQAADGGQLHFSPNGTKMFIAGLASDSVNEYTLSTAFDITTATYIQRINVYAEESALFGAAFNTNGTKMYITGHVGDDVVEYDLSTAFDVSTASFGRRLYIGGTPREITWKPDGTKFFITYDQGSVKEWDLTTAYDVTTGTAGSSFSIGNNMNASGAAFNNDGTRMFVLRTDSPGPQINQYSLSTAYDLSSTITYIDSFSTTSIGTGSGHGSFVFNSDGTKMFLLSSGDGLIHQFTTGTDTTLDLSSGNYFNHTTTADSTFAFSNPPASGTAAGFSLVLTNSNVPSTYDIANASYDSKSFSVGSQETFPSSLVFKPDGTKMFVVGYGNDAVQEYSLSTAWDITTASYSQNFSVGSQEPNSQGLFIKPDGTKFWITGNSDKVWQYSMSTAWDISTASYDSVNFTLNPPVALPVGVEFKSDGTKMYIIDVQGTQSVYQFSLSTAWNLSTASYDSVSFSTSSQDATPLDLTFNSDGTKMYMIGSTTDTIYQYSLSTAWDLSTTSYDNVSFSVSSQETSPRDVFFKPDGTKFYIVGDTNDTVYQYTSTSTSVATVTYPSSVKFPSGIAPTGPTTAETDVLVFYTDDGGTTYQGFRAGDAMA